MNSVNAILQILKIHRVFFVFPHSNWSVTKSFLKVQEQT